LRSVSVIIPNLNSPTVDRTLAALRGQEYDLDRVEVLVVGLDEPELVQEDDLVRMIPTKKPAAPAVARNIGIRGSTGDVLCFTDADCTPAPDWLAQITAPFANGDVHVVGGGVAFQPGNYWTLCDNISWFHDYLASTRAGQREQLPSLNLSVRRAVTERVGLFDESYPRPAGEDAEWTTRMRRAGYTLHFVPSAVVHHHPTRATCKALISHGYDHGRYSVKVHPAYADFLGVHPALRAWWSVLLSSPALALITTGKIFIRDPALRRYWYSAPGIAMSKLAWCFGAAHRLYWGGPGD
jgi:glycosyltransferase involved in cell wall biosynthesis